MTKLDTGAVQALTAQLHRAYCLPGASPATAWSEAHRMRDQRKAVEVLDGLTAAGYDLNRRVMS
ncbi:hypothetical protein ACQP2Y_21815 [Actinoplanes sp. CA-051413]|uniref:hypothetical protein n=1 Tax=Actinoplanes sp. CA-051413 TaxID=3239899 RepID=UPI003D961F59